METTIMGYMGGCQNLWSLFGSLVFLTGEMEIDNACRYVGLYYINLSYYGIS